MEHLGAAEGMAGPAQVRRDRELNHRATLLIQGLPLVCVLSVDSFVPMLEAPKRAYLDAR